MPPPSTSLFFLLPFRTHSRTLSTRASSQSTVEGIKCILEARNFKGTPCRFHSISVLCILRISPRTPFRRSLVNNKSYGPGQPIGAPERGTRRVGVHSCGGLSGITLPRIGWPTRATAFAACQFMLKRIIEEANQKK